MRKENVYQIYFEILFFTHAVLLGIFNGLLTAIILAQYLTTSLELYKLKQLTCINLLLKCFELFFLLLDLIRKT